MDKEHAQNLYDSFMQTLKFPGGWLVDCVLPGSLAAQAPERLSETDSLRRACLPQLCLMLLRVCLESGLRARACSLVDLIVDPEHRLYEVFSSVELNHVLRMAAETALDAELAGGEATQASALATV
jgi:hypothetical protein